MRNEKGRKQSRARGVGRAARRPRLRRHREPSPARPGGWAGAFPHFPRPPPRQALPTTPLPPSASTATTEGFGPTAKADGGPGPGAPGSRRGCWACPAQAAPPGFRPLQPSPSPLHGGHPAPRGSPAPPGAARAEDGERIAAGAAVIPAPPQPAAGRAAPHPSVLRFLLEL